MDINMNKLMQEIIEEYDLSESVEFDKVWDGMEAFAPYIENEYRKNNFGFDALINLYHKRRACADTLSKHNIMDEAARVMLSALYTREVIRGMMK